ncbi:MAG: archease [Dehalococcoidales bacterium]|jgi:SHS2 domain-containing protein|nr:archease [Dehalococcoidales bacterium]MDD4230004.1 archease [Dehalococcoidales bacterium]MDD4465419.1 archease [Dehalococcoidales bacterium]MDD5401726.1 archease [Dehalococcoidales bacterium]
MRNKYKTIEHTADIGLVAYGENLPEAFLNAGIGMSSIMVDLRTVKADTRIDIIIEEDDPEKLLFEWLNRLLYYFDTRSIIFKRFELISFASNRLEASGYGEKYNPLRHIIKTGVKSATFHKIMVDEKKNRVRVLLDI